MRYSASKTKGRKQSTVRSKRRQCYILTHRYPWTPRRSTSTISTSQQKLTPRAKMHSLYLIILATNLRRSLAEKQMSKHSLAEKAGISHSYLSEITFARANPSMRLIVALACGLGVDVASLLLRSDLPLPDTSNSPEFMEPRFTFGFLNSFQAFQVKVWSKKNMSRQKITCSS